MRREEDIYIQWKREGAWYLEVCTHIGTKLNS
jgi:hypothetical protein